MGNLLLSKLSAIADNLDRVKKKTEERGRVGYEKSENIKNMARLYKNALLAKLEKNDKFLLDRFACEWDEVQKAERRRGRTEQVMRGAKAAGRVALGLLAVAGALTIAAVAPNIFVLFDQRGKRRAYLKKDALAHIKRGFRRSGSITLEETGEGTYIIRITEKGKQQALGELYNGLAIKKMAIWDGKWRVVIFDVSEKHKNERDALRSKLGQMGFYQLQKSVLVMPYPCAGEVDFLVSVLNINSYVRFFTTSDIGDDTELRRHFDL